MFGSVYAKLFQVAVVLVFLSGCAGKQMHPVTLQQDLLPSTEFKIGVAMPAVPAADIVYPGADCLLCLGVASAMNSTLSSYVETLDINDVKAVKDEVVAVLKESGSDAIALSQDFDTKGFPDHDSELPNATETDFRSFGAENGITHLLVVNFDYVGFKRNYASYVPTSTPYANITGKAFLVDVNANEYKWYQPVNVSQTTDGEWDEPEEFPGLTNAFYKAIEVTKQLVYTPLKKIN